jgi:hypothetical protein
MPDFAEAKSVMSSPLSDISKNLMMGRAGRAKAQFSFAVLWRKRHKNFERPAHVSGNRSAVAVMRRAGRPMTSREITAALTVGKVPAPTHKQATNIRAAILAALRKRNGKTVVGAGVPARWRLKEAAYGTTATLQAVQ